MRTLVSLAFLLLPTLAQAQAVNWCSVPLSVQASAQEVLDYRLRCTIDKLDAARSQEANHATLSDVEAALAAARERAMSHDLDFVRKELQEEKNYWKAWCGKTAGCAVSRIARRVRPQRRISDRARP